MPLAGLSIKVEDIYPTGKIFTSREKFHTGPMRTSFILTYADRDAVGNLIFEKSARFETQAERDNYLSRFAEKPKSLLTVELR